MKIENPLKYEGLRKTIIKGIIAIAIIVIVQYIIQLVLAKTIFFNKYLIIPEIFQIGKGINRIIFMNAVIFGIVAFFIMSYDKLKKLKIFRFEKSQYWFYVLSIIFLMLHYTLKFLINRNTEFFMQSVAFWGIIKFTLTILFGVSIIVAVYGLKYVKYFINTFKKEIVLFAAIVIVFFFLMLFVQNSWIFLSGVITKILFQIFSLAYANVTYVPYDLSSNTMSTGGGPLFGINSFKVIIGKPCSGVDSFLLFTALYALIIILDYKKIKKGLATGLYFIGAIGMFIVNIIRIALLILVGVYISPKFAVGVFHTNIGWILFIVYFFIFWWIASKYVYKT